jgi:hypothetical protein
VVALAIVAGACSSPRVAAKRSTGTRPTAHAAGTVAAQAPPGAPTVRMFAGVQSTVGVVAQYCSRPPCAASPVSTRRLELAAGSIVTFAVQPAPDQAVLSVDGTGGTRVALATGTLLAYQGRLGPGWHRLALQLRWGRSTGVWIWDVSVPAS